MKIFLPSKNLKYRILRIFFYLKNQNNNTFNRGFVILFLNPKLSGNEESTVKTQKYSATIIREYKKRKHLVPMKLHITVCYALNTCMEFILHF